MSKHTPGPWKAVRNSSYWQIDDAKGFRIGDTCASSASEPNYGCSMALGEANARFIAAAPDMLDALQLVRDYVVLMKGNGHDYQVAIDAAIAKAKGGSTC